MIGFPKNSTEISNCIKKREEQGFISKKYVPSLLKQGDFYLKKGLPHRKMEDWKYFPFAKIQKSNYIFSEGENMPSTIPDSLKTKESHTLFVINGEPQLPSPSRGFSFFSWKEVLSDKVKLDSQIRKKIEHSLVKDRNSLCLLNNALSLNGLVLVIEKDLKQPLTLQYIQSFLQEGNKGLNLRNFIFVKEGCKAQIVENFYGSKWDLKNNNLLTNLQTDLFLEAHSSLDYIRVDQGQDKDVQFNQLFCEMKPHSQIHAITLSLSSEVSRYLTHVSQKKQSKSVIKGLSLLNKKKHVDHKVFISHQEPSSKSFQIYQSLLFDSAQHIFNGKIYIDLKAQQSDANQLNKNHLFGKKAYAVSCPELQVKADDVKAFHGAFVSSLRENQDSFFYLRSRGLTKKQALSLIVSGPIKNTFADLRDTFLKSQLETHTFSHLKLLQETSDDLF